MQNKKRGLFFAVTGCIFWGASGTVAEYLFSHKAIPSIWLVEIRLLFAGLLLLGLALLFKADIFSIWKKPKSIILLLCFSFFGVFPSQLTYFLAIKYGNAPTATVLQFLGPIFIILYLSLSKRQLPSRINSFSILIALIGTFLLVTSGNLNSLSLSPLAVIFGIGAGLSQASYTLVPRKLLSEYNEMVVIGWAMLIGSTVLSKSLFTTNLPSISIGTVGWIAFIITFGTMLSYLFYLKSLRDLSPSVTGMISSFEPLSATFLSVVFLHVSFTPVQIIGGILILSTIFIQSMGSNPDSP